ncbi:ATP-binding protein [Xylanimonas sp. McL0601]|uniref:ATP-binding protein n=1 Tax=Xylanimonas sp. McL0601 TaxID=3414739 RepID=UPI003CFACAC6
MRTFVGRHDELDELARLLAKVAGGGDRPGRALLMRGRRRVGKSRLVQQFVDTAGVPTLFFTADRHPAPVAMRLLAAEASRSTLPGADLFDGQSPSTWDAVFRLLAAALPTDAPSLLVIDEIPYLMDEGMVFEGALQRAWDRDLSRLPVLLIGVGSSLSMMERINAHDRPFHKRATLMRVEALTAADLADMLGLPPADAIDAYLVTGGLPLLCADWPEGAGVHDYLLDSLQHPTSPLVVSAELSLDAEVDNDRSSRAVLTTIGQGQMEPAQIVAALGGTVPVATVHRRLEELLGLGVVTKDQPLSTKAATRVVRYSIRDPYLLFWLRFVEPSIALIDRGRGRDVLAAVEAAWSTWRGRAVEPVVRDALLRMDAARLGLSATHQTVGAWWTRTNSAEVDIVVGDRPQAPAKHVLGVGSIKWTSTPFDERRLQALSVTGSQVPGFDPVSTVLLAVSRNGFRGSFPDRVRTFGPDDLVDAIRGGSGSPG